MSDENKIGIELGSIAGLLFDKAANYWVWNIFLQATAGVLGIVVSLFSLDSTTKFVFALIGFFILASAYYLKIKLDEIYGRAETMRRQAAFSEGLDWPINRTLISDWRMRAGKDVMKKVEGGERNKDYYNTQVQIGPKKLLEMTTESAFYTRHIYAKLANKFLILLFVSISIVFLTLSILPSKILSGDISLQIAYIIYLLLPLLLTIDILGSYLRLNSLKNSILEVEKNMESFSNNVDSEQVIRLVSEYNCILACGYPIHPFIFRSWHDEISTLWKKRR